MKPDRDKELEVYVNVFGLPLVLRWLKSAAARYNAQKLKSSNFRPKQNQQLREANEALRQLTPQERTQLTTKILIKSRNTPE